jgi:B12-binding domain/radical SAM domain protein
LRHRDLILIHPPSVFDFRNKPIFWGPISDTVPSTPVFDTFPIGFISLAEYMHRLGFGVEIINLAAKMLENSKFDVSSFLASLKSEVFGIDLHWLPHVQGCIEIARLLKKLHPNSRIVLGGFTATYYHLELMEHMPFVDAVVRGDSGELPLQRYLEAYVQNRGDESSIPNLSWRNDDGKICINHLEYVQSNLDELAIDYKFIAAFMMKSLLKADRAPYFEWKRHPIAATLSCKGCSYGCVTCGGSRYSYLKHLNRMDIGFRSPEAVARDIAGVNQYSKIPIWIIGDIRQGGAIYTEKLLRRLKEEKIDSPVMLELFEPAGEEFINEASQSIPRLGLSFSPDSGSEAVRRAQGRKFTNTAIEKTLLSALDASVSRLDLFFLLGLGRDTPESVSETFRYAEALMDRFSGKGLAVYMSTLVPTLDPGSIAFDEPRDHGFILRYHTLLEHYQGFSSPSWKYFLNYRTVAYDFDGIVDLTYQVASYLTELKLGHDLLTPRDAEFTKDRILISKSLLAKIDVIMGLDKSKERDEHLAQITEIVQKDQGDRLLHTLNELDRYDI